MIVNVLTTAPLDKAYSYLVPESIAHSATLGAYVKVPFGKREVWGVIWSIAKDDEIIERDKLKEILEIACAPPMPDICRQFIEKISVYTCVPKGLYIKASLSGANGFKTLKRAAKARDPKIYDLEQRPVLTEQQIEAVHQIHNDLKEAKPILLDGVTGSGKTEVYLEAVTQTLAEKKQALILLPEIALTSSIIDRLEKRYGMRPAIWHSAMTPAQRRNIWNDIAKGEELLVIGARSAIFLPWLNLNLIIVDEEHDQSYKQEDMPIYNARDMAILRAHIGQFGIILASATPSLETMNNAWIKRYSHVKLPNRYGKANPPELHLIDMRKDPKEKGRFIGETLEQAITQTLAQDEQVLLYLNRRGYAPLTLCKACGEKVTCKHCETWLVEHRNGQSLKCHHCDFQMPMPEECPHCGEIDSLIACGPGVERIAEEAKALFPDARIDILASDINSDIKTLSATLRDMTDKKVNILIGTQMIAKGHHFPNLTCVGVVDADLGISGGDLRASERTYQLLTQVAGRAGREEKPGHVYLQSFKPEARVMQALVSGNRDDFLALEASERKIAAMPPFARLGALIIKSKNQNHAQQVARQLSEIAPNIKDMHVWGPAQAPLAKIRDQWRYRFLIAADKRIPMQSYIKTWVEAIKCPNGTSITIDIDPQSFL